MLLPLTFNVVAVLVLVAIAAHDIHAGRVEARCFRVVRFRRKARTTATRKARA